MKNSALTISNTSPLILVLIFIGLIIYSPSLSHDFVWDDHPLIDENPKLSQPGIVKSFFTKDFWESSSSEYSSGFYRPLTWLSHYSNFKIWDGNPFGFHLFNVIVHTLNGILLFLLFSHASGRMFASFMTAVIFILHPVQVETVAFVSDVGDLLCVFFLLSSIYSYLVSAKWSGKDGFYYLSILFLACALLCKENAMIGFVLISLSEFYFISTQSWKTFFNRVVKILPFIILTAAYIVLRVIVVGSDNAVTTLGNVRYVSLLPSYDIFSHVLTVLSILYTYLEMFIWPVKQSISYVQLPETQLFSYRVIIVVGALIMWLLSLLTPKKTIGLTSFALTWFFITLLPVSNLIPISNTIAERFMYLPSVGLCLLAGYWLSLFNEKNKTLAVLKIFVAVGMVLILAQRTEARIPVWSNDYTLFMSASQNDPCSAIAHANLSTYYNRQGFYRLAAIEQHKKEVCVEGISKAYRAKKKKYLRK